MPESTNGFVGCDLFSGVYYQDLNKKQGIKLSHAGVVFLLPCLFLPSLELPMPQVPELPNSVCFSCSCNAGLKINVSLIQAISHGSRGVLHKMTSGRLVVVSRLDPLSLSCLIWGFLRPLRVLLSCPGVLASPPLYCCLFGFLGCPVPSYLPTCVYIYISPGSFPISFLDTNNPHCIGRTTWHLALHCIALHCIALQYIALHYIALHGITLHYIASHCIAFIALHCIAMHCITLHCISLHCITFNCITLHRIALHCIAPVRRKPVFHVGVSYQEFFSGIL